MPRLGRKGPEENERRFVHGSHVIVYTVETDRIVIEAILYGPSISAVWDD